MWLMRGSSALLGLRSLFVVCLCVCVSVWPLGVFREERGPFVFAVRSALAPIRPVIVYA